MCICVIMPVMVVVPRYSHHRHTGRLRPHHETSYGLLGFVLLLAGGMLVGLSASVLADTTGSGGIAVQAVVSGARPTTPAVITTPSNGQTFQTNPITVEGTCPDRTLVKVFKNGVLAGGVICGSNRRFSLQMDLVIGKNDLTALAYNANDMPGPESPPVSVTLNTPPGGLGFSSELVIQSLNFYRGTEPGQEVTWPLELLGGQSPYAVNFDWGDGTSDLVTRVVPGPFTLSHTYKKPGNNYLGTYPLIIRASDAAGHTAFLQLTTIVNQPGVKATGQNLTKAAGPLSGLVLAWPIWVVLILMVVSFWLGERREKRIMQRRVAALGEGA